MTIVLRLLDSYGKKPMYEIVRNTVQDLTKRRLLPRHLAQMKYILPEAVQIDYVITKGFSMRSEMKIELLLDVVDGDSEQTLFDPLCVLFASRLRDFYVAHPEPDTDIPEAALPEPVDPTNYILRKYTVTENLPCSCDSESSSLSPFKRC
ncbi:CDT1-like protein a, chloroplastic [Henckelia pumila]|uniref:CDT1-like protein a, chloroplastic n=1 Tax=Henckelia pumila TaxID=405737 RepID=UPI003C6E50E3